MSSKGVLSVRLVLTSTLIYHLPLYQNGYTLAGEITQQIKALTVKPDEPILSPGPTGGNERTISTSCPI